MSELEKVGLIRIYRENGTVCEVVTEKIRCVSNFKLAEMLFTIVFGAVLVGRKNPEQCKENGEAWAYFENMSSVFE